MTQKPTGVFVRLPLSEEQAHSYLRESSAAWDECNGSSDAIACESGLLAIGTLVTGTELYPIGYINEDVIRGLATGVYQSASIFRDEDKEHHDTIALVRLSDAQAQLAARDAEIVQLRKAITVIDSLIMGNSDPVAMFCGIHSECIKALKGGAA